MSDSFDDFMKPHFSKNGDLLGFTTKDFSGSKSYFGDDGDYKGKKIKNPFTKGSTYHGSSNNHLGDTLPDIKLDSGNFLKPDGSFGHTPDMFKIKDPNFHNDVNKHFNSIRSNLLTKIY